MCRSVEAWLKARPVAAFGRYDFPKTVVGTVRLDSDEQGYSDIAHEIRESQRFVSGYRQIAHEIRESQRFIQIESTYHDNGDDEGNFKDTDAGKLDDEELSLDAKSTASASNISTLRFDDSRLLKDIILSLSEEEVNEVLADFCETQAHQQTCLFKSELLAHFGAGTWQNRVESPGYRMQGKY